jgi:hypothetical protein
MPSRSAGSSTYSNDNIIGDHKQGTRDQCCDDKIASTIEVLHKAQPTRIQQVHALHAHDKEQLAVVQSYAQAS